MKHTIKFTQEIEIDTDARICKLLKGSVIDDTCTYTATTDESHMQNVSAALQTYGLELEDLLKPRGLSDVRI